MSAPPQPPGAAAPRAASAAEEARQAALAVVTAMFRMLKVTRIHVDTNQAVLAVIDATVAAVTQYCAVTNAASVSVFFSGDTVFVNGRMLRAGRETYQTALDLGASLAKAEISEVTLARDVDSTSMATWVRGFGAAQKGPTQAAALREQPIRGVRLRMVRPRTARTAAAAQEPATKRLARAYAAALVVLRGFYADAAAGSDELPVAVKRAAQRLVALSVEAPSLLVTLASMRADPGDVAGLVAAQGTLALVMAAQLTSDRVLLSNVVLAAFLGETGAVRLARGPEGARPAGLTLAEDDRVPASAAFMLTVLGRAHPSAMQRAVAGYEALWAERERRVGPVYAGRRAPAMFSRIVATARRFHELAAGREAGAALAYDDVIGRLRASATTPEAKLDLALLTGSLGSRLVASAARLPARPFQPPVPRDDGGTTSGDGAAPSVTLARIKVKRTMAPVRAIAERTIESAASDAAHTDWSVRRPRGITGGGDR